MTREGIKMEKPKLEALEHSHKLQITLQKEIKAG
jgi:hypothetical protein